jgi:two-component system, NarL family, sensor kinase
VAGLAAGGALLLSRAAHERDEVEVRALALAGAVAAAADREIAAVVARLEALSTSPALRAGDLRTFYDQLTETPAPDGTRFTLRAAEGRLLNTLRPYGDPTLPRDRDLRRLGTRVFEEIIRTGRPAVSSLLWGPIAGGYGVMVSLPIRLGEERQAALLQTVVSRERLAEAIFEQAMNPGWSAWLVDRNGRTIARAPTAGGGGDQEVPAAWARRFGEPGGSGLLVGTGPSASRSSPPSARCGKPRSRSPCRPRWSWHSPAPPRGG